MDKEDSKLEQYPWFDFQTFMSGSITRGSSQKAEYTDCLGDLSKIYGKTLGKPVHKFRNTPLFFVYFHSWILSNQSAAGTCISELSNHQPIMRASVMERPQCATHWCKQILEIT